MTARRPTFGTRLRDLALALLNATLMLGVLLVFGAWLLLGRVQDFTAETVSAVAENVGEDLRSRLESQTARASEAIERVATLDERLSAEVNRIVNAPAAIDQAAAAELAGLRDDVQALNLTLDSAVTPADAPDLDDTRARLDTLEAQLSARLEDTRDAARDLDTKTAAEIEALRNDVQVLTTTLQDLQTGLAALRAETSGSLRGALHQLFLDLADRVAPPGAHSPKTEG